jgi:hypothetical protein
MARGMARDAAIGEPLSPLHGVHLEPAVLPPVGTDQRIASDNGSSGLAILVGDQTRRVRTSVLRSDRVGRGSQRRK